MKRFTSIVMVALLVLGVIPVQAATPLRVFIDGEEYFFSPPPLIQNNFTLVPMRAFFEALGASVHWDPQTRSVTSHKDNTTIKLVVDQSYALVNGETVPLDVPAQIISSSTYIPLRFVGEALGAHVFYHNRVITVTSPAPQPPPPTDEPEYVVTLDQTSLSMWLGHTAQLTASISPEQEGTVIWSSSNPNVVEVTDGLVTAKAVGDAVITATYREASASSQVVVSAPPTLDTETVISFGGWEYRARAVEVHKSLSTAANYNVADGKYVVALVDLTNMSLPMTSLGTDFFVLQDAQGRTYGMASNASRAYHTIFNTPNCHLDDILPAGITTVPVVFDVPLDATDLQLVPKAGLDSASPIYLLDKLDALVASASFHGWGYDLQGYSVLPSFSNYFSEFTADGRYMIALLQVENRSLFCREMGADFFVVQDAEGRVYELNRRVTLAYQQLGLTYVSFAEVIGSGESAFVPLVFDVASDATDLLLIPNRSGAEAYPLLLAENVQVEYSIALSHTDVSLAVGETEQLTAIITPEIGATVSWSTSNAAVAEVVDGLIIAKGPGTAEIAASFGGKAIFCFVTVTAPPQQEPEPDPDPDPIMTYTISLDRQSLHLESGQIMQLNATVSPTPAGMVSWSSSNPNVAEVVNGVVTAKSAGTATVTATIEGVSASCEIVVSLPLAPIGAQLSFMDWDYQVIGVETHKNLTGGFSSNIANGKYVVAIVRVENKALFERSLGSSYFIARDEQGRTYNMDTSASLGYYHAFQSSHWYLSSIGPSQSGTIPVVFDVPLDATSIMLQPKLGTNEISPVFLLERIETETADPLPPGVASFGDWRYQVVGVETHSNLSTSVSTNIASGKYVVALVSITNEASFNRSVGSNFFVAKDVQGRTYNMHSSASFGYYQAFGTPHYHHDNIGPSQTTIIPLAFDVALDATDIQLYPKDGVLTTTPLFLVEGISPDPVPEVPPGTIVYQDWMYEVERVETHKELSTFLTTNIASGQYVVAVLTMTNQAAISRQLGSGYFVLKDAQGRTYNMHTSASHAYYSNFGTSGWYLSNVGPSQTLTIPIAFDVPLDATGLVLVPKGSVNVEALQLNP